MNNSTFTNNDGGRCGGAIYNGGGNNLSVNNSIFTGNDGRSGGAIYNGGDLSVSNSIFIGNNASVGGAIYNYGDNFVVSGDNFVNNSATNGSAIYTTKSSTVNYNRFYNNSGKGQLYVTNGTLNANFNWWGNNSNPNGTLVIVTGGTLVLSYYYVLELSLNNTFYTNTNNTRNYSKNQNATLTYNLSLNAPTTNDPSLLPYFEVNVIARNSTSVINNSTSDIRTFTFSQVVMLNNNNLQSSINALVDGENIILILEAEAKVNLTIAKVANVTNILNNGTINFTITITNNGNDFASNVTFTDSLLDNFKLLNASGGSYNSTTGIWTVGDIGSGVTITLNMTAQAIKSGTINNTANNVTAIETLINPNINSTVTITVTPTVNLNITKVSNVTGLNTSHIGDHVKYVITVKNNGLDNASNVKVYDILDSNLTYITYNSSTGTYNNTTGLWNIGTLNVNQTATLEIEVIIANIGTIENIANITVNEIILNGSNTNTSTTIHADPLNSTLVINHIVDTKVNGSVSINGSLLDERGVPISGVPINLTVNNVTYNVTTNAGGNWSIIYHVGSIGVIDVVAEFVGNVNYTGAVNVTYFNGLALNSTLVINHIVDTKVNGSVSINGSLLDERGVPISGVIVNLTVNGVAYNVTTNVGGNWSIIYHVGSIGVIDVVAEFVGNVNYTGAVNVTYFNGLALNSTLVINHIVDTKVNGSVSINGSLLDERGVPISGVI
ncbi:DUF11 domain-containing protein, partial [Methanobrevibacter filiformis]|uniref:DUF11 domain-containing protein n=1 Tax=Methanobrevibacter filiformis TaxID=55758 RepID=UPI000A990007